MYCQNDNVDLCEINEIADYLKYLGDSRLTEAVSKLNFRIWRFLPLMDPMVDRFMSRDTDSEINEREVAAVNQWFESNYTFHVMRDHQEHCAAILAGAFIFSILP